MPLDNLIPLGGASGGKSGAKKGGASDLTSGLISLAGARDNVDVDMSDFDVGDLLGDDSSKKGKSSSKDKNDDAKKKKKSKDKSSNSKKKSKSKSKKSALEDSDDFGNDDADNWTSSAKNWDSAAELEMAAAASARRKNGGGKMGGGFDDEFTKMLGGDTGGTDFGSPPSPEPIGGEKASNFESEDTFEISGYTPTVRGSKKFESPEVTTAASAEHPAKGGISASFFQDSDKDDLNSTSLSSLGSTTERRGGARGSRRQTGAESDPFGFGTTATTSSSTFDSLFGGSSSKRSAFDDPFAKSTREPQEDPNSKQPEPVIETKPGPVRDEAPSAPVAQRLSAKDDLLADLFPSEPRSSRSDRRQQESTAKSEESEYYEKKTRVHPTPEPTQALPVADTAKQQNDLLAELFATPSSYKPKEKGEEPKPKSEIVKETTVTPPRQKSPPPEPVDSVLPSGNTDADLASARDSLLMDLLGDLSPPKPSAPLLSRRRSRSTNNSTNNSPEKEVVKVEDPFKSSLPPSPVQTQSLPTVPEVSTTSNERLVTPPSPGRIRSLTMDKGSLAIRESDFEQSKDSLLEEILPSSPSVSARSSPHRRNSYSQSFDVEGSIVVEAEEQRSEVVEDQNPPIEEEEPPAPEPVAPVVKISSSPQPKTQPKASASKPKTESEASTAKPEPKHSKPAKQNDIQVVLAPACNCEEREAKFTASFELERAGLKQKIDELTHQLEDQAASSAQLTLQLNQQLEEREASTLQLSQQLEARAAANAQLALQLTAAERDKLHADQLALASKEDAASYQHRAELLEAEMRSLREELTRSKRSQQDAELALARKTAEYDEADQLERHREKRALEALSAQMQRALARLTVSHQVQEEGSGYDNSAARVAAEDEARLRVIASLEGSSKRAAQHAEQERLKLAELLRDLEAGARNARQGALEDKERLRQEQQRLDALSAHLQAQAAALRDQEAAHATYMGQQLAEAREDARVQESRLNTRRTQLERDERALYEARADFAAFREQTALEIEREYEELRVSRLRLEDAWRELRTDREDLEAELASHEDEYQALESMREEVQESETRLNERTQEVVALAEKLDAGTRDLLEREQVVAQQAAIVQDTDTSFSSRERALERVKNELEAREQRLHVQIRQLDGARVRLTQQRREQQQLMASRRHYSAPVNAVDNNKRWRQSEFTSTDPRGGFNSNKADYSPPAEIKTKAKPWEAGLGSEEDPSGLPRALRKQVEANWQRQNQQLGQRRYGSGLTFDLGDFDATSAYPPSWFKTKDASSVEGKQNSASPHQKVPVTSQDSFKSPREQQATPTPSFRNPQLSHSVRRSHHPPPPGAFQPTLRVNL